MGITKLPIPLYSPAQLIRCLLQYQLLLPHASGNSVLLHMQSSWMESTSPAITAFHPHYTWINGIM